MIVNSFANWCVHLKWYMTIALPLWWGRGCVLKA